MSKVKLYPRKCDCCGKGMSKGYFDAESYYCSDRCLICGNSASGLGEEQLSLYTMKDWENDHNKDPDNCYYTEWEELDSDENYDDEGNLYIKTVKWVKHEDTTR